MDDYLRDLTGYGAHPPHPHWPGKAKLALQFVVNIEEGAEQSIVNGDRYSETYLQEIPARQARINERDKSVESFYEYGSRAGFWRIMRIFSRYQLPLTAFAAGRSLELNPDAAYALAEAGHEIAGHGYRWLNYNDIDSSEEQEHIQRTIEIIHKLCGKPPSGWYTGRCSHNTRNLLIQQGSFLYDSDAYNDDLPYWFAAQPSHLIIPYTLVNNDFRYLSGSGMADADTFYKSLCAAFNVLLAEGEELPRLMTIGLHSRISGHPARADALIRFIEYVLEHKSVWICRREQIATHWQHHFKQHL